MIYLAACLKDYTGHVKIGFTERLVEERLKGLQTGSAGWLEPLCVARGGREVEKYLHYCYDDYRVTGEWFDFQKRNPVDSVRTMINRSRFTTRGFRVLSAGYLLGQYLSTSSTRINQKLDSFVVRSDHKGILRIWCSKIRHEMIPENTGYAKSGVPYCVRCSIDHKHPKLIDTFTFMKDHGYKFPSRKELEAS